jgi:orotidine-5'-phosphate decarboxylase
MSTMTDPRVIVALDYPDAEPALALARRLDPARCKLKVGKELFVRAGPALVGALAELGFKVFLDLKFHDIPNTVAQACKAAADLGVWMVNVHASGGLKMMRAAREAVD